MGSWIDVIWWQMGIRMGASLGCAIDNHKMHNYTLPTRLKSDEPKLGTQIVQSHLDPSDTPTNRWETWAWLAHFLPPSDYPQ